MIAVELLDEVHGALTPVRTAPVGAGSCVVEARSNRVGNEQEYEKQMPLAAVEGA